MQFILQLGRANVAMLESLPTQDITVRQTCETQQSTPDVSTTKHKLYNIKLNSLWKCI